MMRGDETEDKLRESLSENMEQAADPFFIIEC